MSIKALDVDVTSNSMRNKSLLVVVLKYCLALRAQALRLFLFDQALHLTDERRQLLHLIASDKPGRLAQNFAAS